MSISNPFSRFTLSSVFVILALGLAAFLLHATPPATTISAEQIAQARLAPGTDALLTQTALHLSKLLGGTSIGGFPPFRPPDDDERFKEKIKNRSYNPQEFDYWLKETNKFIAELAKKNPDLPLREMLVRNGATQAQADDFLAGLQQVYRNARISKAADGINPLTFARFEELLLKLGVVP